MDTLKIHKLNELYIKVECDPGIAYELNDFFTFEVPGAKFMPAYKNKVWDGKIRLFNILSCTIYAGLLRYIENFCKSRNYEIEYLSDFSSYEFSVKEAKEFISSLNLPEKYQPRDYQLDAFIHAVRENRALLLSPTASGKSFIIYLLTRYYNARTLIIVPTTSLVSQLAGDFSDYGFQEYIHKIVGGENKDPTFYKFICENGNEYTFEGNENIKIINSNIKYKKVKDVTLNDEIDDKWLQEQNRK